jgi:hypothetical protein
MAPTTKAPTLTEIAERINAHLKRFERDPKINKPVTYKSARTGRMESAGRPYYYAGAWRAGNRVAVKYVSYQSTHNLTQAEAEDYLRWLDNGGVGTYYEGKTR